MYGYMGVAMNLLRMGTKRDLGYESPTAASRGRVSAVRLPAGALPGTPDQLSLPSLRGT